jgi:hypothetical protein
MYWLKPEQQQKWNLLSALLAEDSDTHRSGGCYRGREITATFTPTNASSSGGNQAVTVTANGITSGSKNFFNQVPTSLTAISVTTLPTGTDASADGCIVTGQDFGIKVAATYQVQDQSSNAINSSAVEPQETIINQCINGRCSNPVRPLRTLARVGSQVRPSSPIRAVSLPMRLLASVAQYPSHPR